MLSRALDFECGWKVQSTRRAIIGAAREARRAGIARTLGSRDLVFLPWFVIKEGEEIPQETAGREVSWGIDLRREAWDEIFEDEDKLATLLPVLALAQENDPDPEMRSWKAPPDRELRELVLADLAVGAQRLYDYFRPLRVGEMAYGKTGGEISAPGATLRLRVDSYCWILIRAMCAILPCCAVIALRKATR